MSEEHIVRYSTPARRGKTMTDWARVNALTDRDIEKAVASDPDAPPIMDEQWWRNATLVMPERKVPVSMRVDREILEWFKRQGRGYQSRMHAVLAAYYRAHSARDRVRSTQSGRSTPRHAARKRSAK
ncbi:MAG TPA: BrnA antitoxin family protein [Candidatus Binataceae bacterium]|nr:BrnA antitoxin family protein [Candidatus Binataceae bacterium]